MTQENLNINDSNLDKCENCNDLRSYFLCRAKERSTWLGVIAILSSIGAELHPETVNHIVNIGVGLAGLIAIGTKDN